MIKLSKYFKPFVVMIALIVGLLFVQAQSDLTLPEYMSKIVDSGIQTNGIESTLPDVIRKSTLDKLAIFVDEADRQLLLDGYEAIDQSGLSEVEYQNKLKQYPLLASEELYQLKSLDDASKATLEAIIAKPLLIVSSLDAMIADPEKAKSNPFLASLPAGSDPYVAMQQMPAQAIGAMKQQILAVFEKMPESTIASAAKKAIVSEYTTIGIDMAKVQSNYILRIGGLMLLIALIGSIANIIVSFLASRVAAGFSRNVRNAVFRKITSFSNTEFNKFSTASLITRTSNDVQQVQQIVVMILRMVVYAPIVGFGALLKVLNTNSSMSWIIGAVIFLIVAIIAIAFVAAFPKFKLIQKLVDKLNLVMREELTGMPVIRAFNTEQYEEKKFEDVNQKITKVNLFVNRLMSILMPMMMFLMNVTALLIVWFGSKQIDLGALQVGEMMAFIQYSMQIIMSFLMITMVSIMLPSASVSANRIAEVLAIELSITDPEQKQPLGKDTQAEVEFRNVSFRYPGAEEDILSNITFTAKPGETTAFIGSTGSGKSTIVNLIPRFFDVTNGELLINGVDVRQYSQHDLRGIIGFVPQKGVLFSGTIASNLRYGKEEATEQELIDAAGIAQSMDFINQKELKFDDPISQGGTNVSGGQKQRLSIARALVTKAQVYIFDDTFSALDYKTESNLRKELELLVQKTKSTVFVVAQRINTIMHANQIIVLDQGQIVGKGTHEELMRDCQVYQEIAYSQLSKEELAHE